MRLDLTVWISRDFFVDTYRNRVYPIFIPLDIKDMPAVEQLSKPTDSVCTITVGIASFQALDVMVSINSLHDGIPTSDPCAAGRRAAEAVVANLPPLR